MQIAEVVVDIPTRALDSAFDYQVPAELGEVHVGTCVLVHFAGRPAVGYVTALKSRSLHESVKAIDASLGGPYFDEVAVEVAHWIAREYVAALSEALRLFLPPGGTPRAVRHEDEHGHVTWELKRAQVKEADDRWVELVTDHTYVPKASATAQIAVLEALANGPLRAPELTADLGNVSSAVRALEKAGAVRVERRRRFRDAVVAERQAVRHGTLTQGQAAALEAIDAAGPGTVFVIDGVTGSGKTEVYLRAIERVVEAGKQACVLVPEISLTPQTVGRFRARFGDQVAVLHSRLSAGERFDQWDRVRTGEANIVVGARSALFAPLRNVGLFVIDEEHESSYKQGSAPRYTSRDVAGRLAKAHGAVLVLGSASPSMEALERCETGGWTRLEMPQRVTGHDLPPVVVVNMANEFADGHRSMFSRLLVAALNEVRDAGRKAVLFLNRRGFASFLLCRECGYVPTCDSCSTSMTFHDVGSRLMCHHCGATRAVPATCPQCDSPYLRQFGAGTQRVESELEALVGDWPIVRMDADTTKGKGAHERLLVEFEQLESGVLLGTQMIAKGLDYPEVTLVGVISADITLNVPDFRAGERTYQLLEQVAGRAGRGQDPGRVVIQTYWPDHPAIVAAAKHDPGHFYGPERSDRAALGYPPFGRLANVLIRSRDGRAAQAAAQEVAQRLVAALPLDHAALGPSPAPLSRVKGVWRWHVLVKAPADADLASVMAEVPGIASSYKDVSIAIDVDPVDLL